MVKVRFEIGCPKCGLKKKILDDMNRFPCWECQMVYDIDFRGHILDRHTFADLMVV